MSGLSLSFSLSLYSILILVFYECSANRVFLFYFGSIHMYYCLWPSCLNNKQTGSMIPIPAFMVPYIWRNIGSGMVPPSNTMIMGYVFVRDDMIIIVLSSFFEQRCCIYSGMVCGLPFCICVWFNFLTPTFSLVACFLYLLIIYLNRPMSRGRFI